RGDSLDSPKHRGDRSAINDESEGPGAGGHDLEPEDSFLEELMAHEDQARLSQRLKPLDRDILAALADGSNAREIAHLLHISRRAVNLHRVIIAKTATRIG